MKNMLHSIDDLLMLPCYSDGVSQEAHTMISKLIRLYDNPIIPQSAARKEVCNMVKLSDLNCTPMRDILDEMNMIQLHVHCSKDGTIETIDIRYEQKEENK